MNGFEIQPDYLPAADAMKLIREIQMELGDKASAVHNGRSRIMRFGWDYLTDRNLGPKPDWLPAIDGFDSWTVNEYPPQHTIKPHFDAEKFDDRISILSLGADSQIQFISPNSYRAMFKLPARSLASMWGDLRWKWKHATLPADGWRYSVVYRKLKT